MSIREIDETNPFIRNYTYQFATTQTEDAIGPLKWSLQNTANPYISINSNTGLFSLQYGHSCIENVTVRATNVNNDFTQNIYDMTIVHGIQLKHDSTINKSRALNEEFIYTSFKDQYQAQVNGTGPLTWDVFSDNPVNLTITNAGPNAGTLRFTSNEVFSGRVTVATSNVIGYTSNVSFNLNVAQTPIIINPGTLFMSGKDVRTYQYQFASLIPPNITGPLTWEVTELDGLSINESSGLLTYNFSNIVGDQKLKVGSSPPIDISTVNLANSYQTTPKAVFTGSTLAVFKTCTWQYASSPGSPGSPSSIGRVVCNQNLGTTVVSFPSNKYLSRGFQVTATNVALGFDKLPITLNLEGVVVAIPIEVFLAIQNQVQNVPYVISSSDVNEDKVLPPPFTPSSITGCTSIIFTWAAAPAADVFITWTPSTTYNQPAVYRRASSQPIVVPGFIPEQQYNLIFSVMPSPTTLADVKSVLYTPTFLPTTGTVTSISGATTVTMSMSITSPSSVHVSWSPLTATNQPLIVQATPTPTATIAISGFQPSTSYTFSFEIQPDVTGAYGSGSFTRTYTTNFLPAQVTVNDPDPSTTENKVALSWSFITPPTRATIIMEPDNKLYPILRQRTTPTQTSTTFENVELGQPYKIYYAFDADPSGVYAPKNDDIQTNVVVKNYFVIDNLEASGGTTVTLQWISNAPTDGQVQWLGQTRSFICKAGQNSVTLTNFAFQIGTLYTFLLTFNETSSRLITVKTQLYVPQYEATVVTLNAPVNTSAYALRLSWRNIVPRLPLTGMVSYKLPPIPDEPDQFATIPFVSANTVAASNLTLGYNYEFSYAFNPDSSGIYGGLSLSQSHIMKAFPIATVTSISGGSTITLTWDLVIDEVTRTPVTDSIVTITWDPPTSSMGSGIPTSGNSVQLSTFEIDGATEYRFTLAFQQTQKTYPVTITYPPLTSPGYIPFVYEPDTPIITTTSTRTNAAVASLAFNWLFGYTANGVFNPVNTLVQISWNIPTGIIQPVAVDGTTTTINGFVHGTQYVFTFVFTAPTSGTILGTTKEVVYLIPDDLEITSNDVTFTRTSDSIATINWPSTPNVPISGIARPTSGPAIQATNVTASSALLTNVVPGTSYQVELLFAQTATTWSKTIIKEYIHTA